MLYIIVWGFVCPECPRLTGLPCCLYYVVCCSSFCFFFLNDPATPDFYPFPLPDALPTPLGMQLEPHDVPRHHAVVVPVLELAAEGGDHFASIGMHAIGRPRAHEDAPSGDHPRPSSCVSPLAFWMQSSRWRFTSCSVKASSGASASAGLPPRNR